MCNIYSNDKVKFGIRGGIFICNTAIYPVNTQTQGRGLREDGNGMRNDSCEFLPENKLGVFSLPSTRFTRNYDGLANL